MVASSISQVKEKSPAKSQATRALVFEASRPESSRTVSRLSRHFPRLALHRPPGPRPAWPKTRLWAYRCELGILDRVIRGMWLGLAGIEPTGAAGTVISHHQTQLVVLRLPGRFRLACTSLRVLGSQSHVRVGFSKVFLRRALPLLFLERFTLPTTLWYTKRAVKSRSGSVFYEVRSSPLRQVPALLRPLYHRHDA